jgi:3-oxosteroid 1-dehydrogenase
MSRAKRYDSEVLQNELLKESEMAKENEAPKKLSRKDFVKGAAAVAGVGALASCAPAATPAPAETPEPCPTCPPAEECPPCVVPGIPQEWDYEADVVVVGFGGAGACAAMEAHDNGANVLVLEKQPEDTHYPNTRMSGGNFCSPEPDGDTDALRQYITGMFSGHNLPWRIEGEEAVDECEELVEAWIPSARESVEWVQTLDPEAEVSRRGGAAYPMLPGAEDAGYTYGVVVYPDSASADPDAFSFDLPKSQKSAGEALWACLMTGVQSRDIDVLYSTPAKRLIQSGGEIIGVVAERDGIEIACKAKKAVILTSGGFEYNAALRRSWLEGPGVVGWSFIGTPENTGDGIEMAMAAGAALNKVAKSAARVIIAVPYGKRYEESGLKIGMNSAVGNVPRSFMVDNYGKRYINEQWMLMDPWRYSFYKTAAQYNLTEMDFPNLPSWAIFDEELFSTTRCIGFNFGTTKFGMIPWAKDNSDALERGWILKADTIAELAATIKNHPDNANRMDAETLTATVDKFNGYCATGDDLEFGRSADILGPVETPPFYAIPLYAGGPNTKGGVKANGDRYVVDWKGEPIPRLFSAGEMSSAYMNLYQCGGNVGECVAFGRIAGKNAAALTSWE